MWDKFRQLSKRNIIALLLLGIGVLSLPLGVDLVQQQQNLTSKATGIGDNAKYNTNRGVKTVAEMKAELRMNTINPTGWTARKVFNVYMQAGRPNHTVDIVTNVGNLEDMPATIFPPVVNQGVVVSVMQKPQQPNNQYCDYSFLNVHEMVNGQLGPVLCKADGFNAELAPDNSGLVADCNFIPTRVGTYKLRVYMPSHSDADCSQSDIESFYDFEVLATVVPTTVSTPVPQSNARGTADCSNQSAVLNWSGFSAPSGTTITNYTMRVNKAPFGEWNPTVTCSESAPTQGDCTLAAGLATNKTLKLSEGSYGFSVQPAFSNGGAGVAVNMPEFSCTNGNSTLTPTVTQTPSASVTPVVTGTLPSPPSSLRASAFCSQSGDITLRWKRGDGATSYKVLVAGEVVIAVIPTDANIRPYAVFRATKGQNYSWGVQSINSTGVSREVKGENFRCR